MRISATNYPLPNPYAVDVPEWVAIASDSMSKNAAFEAEAARLKVLVSPLLTGYGGLSASGTPEFVQLMRQASLEGEVYVVPYFLPFLFSAVCLLLMLTCVYCVQIFHDQCYCQNGSNLHKAKVRGTGWNGSSARLYR